jgi:hypothetical protein
MAFKLSYLALMAQLEKSIPTRGLKPIEWEYINNNWVNFYSPAYIIDDPNQPKTPNKPIRKHKMAKKKKITFEALNFLKLDNDVLESYNVWEKNYLDNDSDYRIVQYENISFMYDSDDCDENNTLSLLKYTEDKNTFLAPKYHYSFIRSSEYIDYLKDRIEFLEGKIGV